MKEITEIIDMKGCTFKKAALIIFPNLIIEMIMKMKDNFNN